MFFSLASSHSLSRPLSGAHTWHMAPSTCHPWTPQLGLLGAIGGLHSGLYPSQLQGHLAPQCRPRSFRPLTSLALSSQPSNEDWTSAWNWVPILAPGRIYTSGVSPRLPGESGPTCLWCEELRPARPRGPAQWLEGHSFKLAACAQTLPLCAAPSHCGCLSVPLSRVPPSPDQPLMREAPSTAGPSALTDPGQDWCVAGWGRNMEVHGGGISMRTW